MKKKVSKTFFLNFILVKMTSEPDHKSRQPFNSTTIKGPLIFSLDFVYFYLLLGLVACRHGLTFD